MIIRSFQQSDYEQIKLIHEKYYNHEFTLSDFLQGFIDSFVITDSSDIILVTGGVRNIAESVIMTNKDISTRKRREALFTALQISKFICNSNRINQLHAFIQDYIWLEQLKKIGFKHTKGHSIYLDM